jgi:hypothetical protein
MEHGGTAVEFRQDSRRLHRNHFATSAVVGGNPATARIRPEAAAMWK